MRSFLIASLGLGLVTFGLCAGTGCSLVKEDTESASPQLNASQSLVISQVFGGSLGASGRNNPVPNTGRDGGSPDLDGGPAPDPEPTPNTDGGPAPDPYPTPNADGGPTPDPIPSADGGPLPVSTPRYVELFNRGAAAVSLAGNALQVTSAGGNFASADALPLPDVTLEPGQHFLVQIGGSAPPSTKRTRELTPDVVFVNAWGPDAKSGKVALVGSTSLLDACGSVKAQCAAGSWVDLVGYGGDDASQFEGEKAVDPLSNTSAAIRREGGCQDTNDNFKDFDISEPGLHNLQGSPSPCKAVPELDASVESGTNPELDSGTKPELDSGTNPELDSGPTPPPDAGVIIIIIVGEAGAQGDKGDKGDTGDKGDKGDTGDKGDKGDKGGDGKNGADGKPGENGKDGENGIGEPGPAGAAGPAGPKGANGKNGQDGGCRMAPAGTSSTPASPVTGALGMGLVLAALRRRKKTS